MKLNNLLKITHASPIGCTNIATLASQQYALILPFTNLALKREEIAMKDMQLAI
jgi:hypothetical protein